MPSDVIRFGLDGDVSLGTFSKAVRHLDELVNALGAELAPGDVVEWGIQHLEAGSAHAEIRGVGERAEAVDDVVRAVTRVFAGIEDDGPGQFGEAVLRPARALHNLVGGNIIRVYFETDYGRKDVEALQLWVDGERYEESYGVTEGVVDSIVKKSLRFTLVDPWTNHTCSCYVKKSEEEQLRSIWGKRVAVGGRILRRADTGRTLNVRDINRIDLIPGPNLEMFRQARGVLPVMAMEGLPEERIRSLRDAE